MRLPKPQTIIAFLESKGWKLEETDDYYFYLQPPSSIKFREGFRYKIPTPDEEDPSYPEIITRLVFGLADLYDLDKLDLYYALTKEFNEFQDELKVIEMESRRRSQLAHA